MNRRAGTACTADDILIVSGSLQALDLVNGALAGPGDVVLVEGARYGGALSRLGPAARAISGWIWTVMALWCRILKRC